MHSASESRSILIRLAISIVVLILFALSLGVVLLVSPSDVAFDAAVTPSTVSESLAADQSSAVIATPRVAPVQPILTLIPATPELLADADQSPTSPSRVPSAISLLPATIVPTTPAPTETPQPPATGAPTETPQSTATGAPTLTLLAPSTTSPPLPAPVVTPTPVAAPTIPLPTLLTSAESSVTVPSTFVYNGPSTNNPIIGGVQRDDKVVILGSSGSWYLIRVTSIDSSRSRIEGGQGWIPQDTVSPLNQQVPVITP